MRAFGASLCVYGRQSPTASDPRGWHSFCSVVGRPRSGKAGRSWHQMLTGELPVQSGPASGRAGSQANDPDRLLVSESSSRNQLIGLGLMVVGLTTILAAIFLIHNGCT